MKMDAILTILTCICLWILCDTQVLKSRFFSLKRTKLIVTPQRTIMTSLVNECASMCGFTAGCNAFNFDTSGQCEMFVLQGGMADLQENISSVHYYKDDGQYYELTVKTRDCHWCGMVQRLRTSLYGLDGRRCGEYEIGEHLYSFLTGKNYSTNIFCPRSIGTLHTINLRNENRDLWLGDYVTIRNLFPGSSVHYLPYTESAIATRENGPDTVNLTFT